ncbi:MAG: hypothetical protein CM15mP9_3030 [Methanobacteriota archaeon]|nr:MAG: hypothetical protein CM15mP9_3030 [Euryarchaeota archaeon]
MSKNGEGYSSFIVSFVCFFLAYIPQGNFVTDPILLWAPRLFLFLWSYLLTLIGVVTRELQAIWDN